MKSKIYLESLVQPRKNIKVIVYSAEEHLFFCADVVECYEYSLSVKDLEGEITTEWLSCCYVPYVTMPNGYKCYLSHNWRERLKYEDLNSEVHFDVPTSGNNKDKAIRVKGYVCNDGKMRYIPWSNNPIQKDINLLGYVNVTQVIEYN